MTNYFYDMIPAEDLAKLQYLPTITQLLEKMKSDYPTLSAINQKGISTTYAELYERVGRRRTFLKGLNLPQGSKIAIFDRNSQDAIELYLAVTTLGYVAINFPAQLAGPALVGSLRKFDVAAMFVRDEFQSVCEAAGVTVAQYPADSIADTFEPAVQVEKDTLASIFFTTGSTGTPKGVMLTHGNVMRGSHNGLFQPDFKIGGERYICFLPFSHVYGVIRGLLSCFWAGAEVYTCEDMKIGIGSLRMIKPTCLVLVPGLAEIMFGLAKLQGPEFLGGKLHTLICGAANCPPRLMSQFKELNISLLQGYGLTESSNLVSGNADTDRLPNSVGKFYPNQEYKIVNGELWLRGDHIFQGYYGDEATTKASFEDGWFKTGDLVKVDEEGFLFIVGRIKNLIILKNGENVSPEAIEEPFYKYPYIKDCLVKEIEKDGELVIGIEILPNMPFLQGMTPEQIEAKMKETVAEVNAKTVSFMHIMDVKVRTEDFKRSGSLKILRNQN